MASVDRWKGNKWRARYRTPDGQSRSRVFDRKLDAERFLTTMEASKLTGAFVDPRAGRITVADYAERMNVYLRCHILPHLGRRPLGQVLHTEVQAWVRTLSEEMSAGTVQNVYRVLSGMMRSAVKDRLIATNPCEDVVLPRYDRAEVIPPTVDEVATLLAAMPARYRVLGTLAAGAGLRQGEALGLTVDRVDFLRRQLRVDRQLVNLARQEPTFAPPKSSSSIRTVPLADSVLEALSAHLAAFPPGPDGLVVTYIDGRPVKRNRFGAMWRQSVARAQLERPYRFHDLRHHFASLLIAGGCSVKVVQKALGHSSAKQTLDVYAHLWPDSDDLTRQAVEAALGAAVSRTCHAVAL
jgi:integrase